MIFSETKLRGAFLVELQRRGDNRGFFARTFCQHEFAARGLDPRVAQMNVAHTVRVGTVRGLHFQWPPCAEVKLVRATRGAVLDVIVDLRPESDTYLQHECVELSAENRSALYVPERFAHGYQTLEDNSEVCYQASAPYAPSEESGLSPSDPRLRIEWPLPISEISEKDANRPLLHEMETMMIARMQLGGAARKSC